HGADTIQQLLNAGLLDEISVDITAVLLGSGVRLFDHLAGTPAVLGDPTVIAAVGVTHLRYPGRTRRHWNKWTWPPWRRNPPDCTLRAHRDDRNSRRRHLGTRPSPGEATMAADPGHAEEHVNVKCFGCDAVIEADDSDPLWREAAQIPGDRPEVLDEGIQVGRRVVARVLIPRGLGSGGLQRAPRRVGVRAVHRHLSRSFNIRQTSRTYHPLEQKE